MPPTYWLDLFTGRTWQEFLEAGAQVSGFRPSKWKVLQKVKVGDVFLCYLTGLSRWIGALEVTSRPFRDHAPIWKDEDFPCRVEVKVLAAVTPETAIPIKDLSDRLAIFRNLKNPRAWTGHVRGSPTRLKEGDGLVILQALKDAKANPVVRPVDQAKLARRPKTFRARIGQVTIPEPPATSEEPPVEPQLATTHEEIQWLLLKLGSDLGLDLWVARNDRGREFRGQRFRDLPRLRESLPVQFDEATNRTIELIDVLWLQGNAIIAAFEVEHTSAIYSGLLRMADLLAMQPNLKIPLFIVAPEERRDRVVDEINRPTFSRLRPPLSEVCRYISYTVLKEKLSLIGSVTQYLKPDFVEQIAESCVTET